MFAAIFEVQPKQGKFDEYLSLAKYLRPKLEAIVGFIEIDRFGNDRAPRRVLSLSTWRDEKAVVRWRTQRDHQAVQEKGRFEIFEDYHLRVGEVIADTAPPRGLAVVEQRLDATEVGQAKVVTLTELAALGPDAIEIESLGAQFGLGSDVEGLIEQNTLRSLYHPEKLLLIAAWRNAARARSWWLTAPMAATWMRHRCVRVIRDYGMFDRREAPQFYRDVKRVEA